MKKLTNLMVVVVVVLAGISLIAPTSETLAQDGGWAVGQIVGLSRGQPIRVGSGLSYAVHTCVPEDNWLVFIKGGPRYADGLAWWDIDRQVLDQLPTSGTGWVAVGDTATEACLEIIDDLGGGTDGAGFDPSAGRNLHGIAGYCQSVKRRASGTNPHASICAGYTQPPQTGNSSSMMQPGNPQYNSSLTPIPGTNLFNDDRLAHGTSAPPESGQCIRVIVYGLRLRSGPGLGNRIVSWVVYGEYYQLLEEQNGWGRISTSRGEGWIYLHSDFVSRECGVSEPSLVTVSVENWGQTYQFSVNPIDCSIVNGSTIVAQELSRFSFWMSEFTDEALLWGRAAMYFVEVVGGVEWFRREVEREIRKETGCDDPYYIVGDYDMDMSGLGNIVFGFAAERFFNSVSDEDLIANLTQMGNFGSLFQYGDNPDDISQRRTGRSIFNILGYTSSISPLAVEQAAATNNLN